MAQVRNSASLKLFHRTARWFPARSSQIPPASITASRSDWYGPTGSPSGRQPGKHGHQYQPGSTVSRLPSWAAGHPDACQVAVKNLQRAVARAGLALEFVVAHFATMRWIWVPLCGSVDRQRPQGNAQTIATPTVASTMPAISSSLQRHTMWSVS